MDRTLLENARKNKHDSPKGVGGYSAIGMRRNWHAKLRRNFYEGFKPDWLFVRLMDLLMSPLWRLLPFLTIVLTACTSCGTREVVLVPLMTLNSNTEVTDVEFLRDGKSFVVVDLNQVTLSKTEPNKPLMKSVVLSDGTDNGFAFACVDSNHRRILVAKQDKGLACFDDLILDPKPVNCIWNISNFYHPIDKSDAITMIDETLLTRVSSGKAEPIWQQKTRFTSIEGTHAISSKWIALAEHTEQQKPIVKLYSHENGAAHKFVIEHKKTIRGIAFSLDESKLATVDEIGYLKVHDLNSDSMEWETKVDADGAFAIAFHPNQDYLAVGCLKGIKILSLKEKKLVASWNAHTRFIPTVAFSPDGAYLLTGSIDKTTMLWQTSDFIGKIAYKSE